MDLYQLGSLLLFLFTGVATTPALGTYLLIDQYPQNWRDSYDDVLPYPRSALDQLSPGTSRNAGRPVIG
jgi:hypothetical protein